MIIKKKGNDTISITSQNKNKYEIAIDDKGFFEIKSEGTSIIYSPGEYEYSHVHFIGLEQSDDLFEGKINVLNIIDESGDSYVFISNVKELNKDIIDKLANIDVVVMPVSKEQSLMNFIKKTNPYYVIFLNNFKFGDEDEKTSEYLDKQFKKETDAKDDAVNIATIDKDSEEDQITLSYII